MRFLPVFLDLKAGPSCWWATASSRGRSCGCCWRPARTCAGMRPTAITISPGLPLGDAGADRAYRGDPLTADLSGAIAVLCAGAGDIGLAMSARAQRPGFPSTSWTTSRIRPSSFPRSSIAATWWSRSAPAAPRRWSRAGCASASRRCCRRASAISPASSAAGARRLHARIPRLPLRRRFWERVIDGPIGALVLAGRKARGRSRAERDRRSVRVRRRKRRQGQGPSRWSAPAPAIPIC